MPFAEDGLTVVASFLFVVRERERMKLLRKRASQTSESVWLALVLACSGGLMDAYSFLGRGKVFANAQTGNLLLLGVNISEGNWDNVNHYLFPVIGFALGCALAHEIKLHLSHGMHWRQYVVACEVILLGVVACMPEASNLVANSLTSLACGMQVQAFRKLHGRPFATTMCIGNLRSGTQALVSYIHGGVRRDLRTAFLYYVVIVTFVLGAILGNFLLSTFSLRAILASCVLLLVAFVLMFEDREKRQRLADQVDSPSRK
jgi:uncharacterized membrane protein YoaK (UPF0700 family)